MINRLTTLLFTCYIQSFNTTNTTTNINGNEEPNDRKIGGRN